MSIHKAELFGSKREQERVDEDAMRAYLEGKVELASGLALEPEVVTQLRRQALALSAAGKWQRCIDVLLALSALGSVHPMDPMLLAQSYRALGMEDAATECAAHAERMMRAMGLELPPSLVEPAGRAP